MENIGIVVESLDEAIGKSYTVCFERITNLI